MVLLLLLNLECPDEIRHLGKQIGVKQDLIKSRNSLITIYGLMVTSVTKGGTQKLPQIFKIVKTY
jgi:hypothetical protein